MKKSRNKILDTLRQLQKERRTLIQRLSREQEIAVGSVSKVRRKCGNPNCHCAKGAGHPQVLFLFKDSKDGRRRCKLIRKTDEARIIRAGDRYRKFRNDLKQLRAIDQREKQILMALLEDLAIFYE